MINIFSVGDSILPGTYCFHSGFGKAINFVCNDNLLTIVTKEIGNGPVNIVVSDITAFSCEKIRLNKKDDLICGLNKYNLQKSLRYNSGIEEKKINQTIFFENINKLLPLLAEHAAPLSLAFVFNNSRENNFRTSFEKNFLNKVNSAIEKMENREIVKGVEMLHGCGFGLTPSGDDFIAGMLNALYILQIISGNQNFSELRNNIRHAAQTENIISMNAISFASEGRFNEVFKNLVYSLSENDYDLLKNNTIRLLQTGETSGADMLTGFLFTFVFLSFRFKF
jgi:hypothetical protein